MRSFSSKTYSILLNLVRGAFLVQIDFCLKVHATRAPNSPHFAQNQTYSKCEVFKLLRTVACMLGILQVQYSYNKVILPGMSICTCARLFQVGILATLKSFAINGIEDFESSLKNRDYKVVIILQQNWFFTQYLQLQARFTDFILLPYEMVSRKLL